MAKSEYPKIFDLEALEYLRASKPNGVVISIYLLNKQEKDAHTVWDSLKHTAKGKIKASRIEESEKKLALSLIEKAGAYLKTLTEIDYYNTLVIFVAKDNLDVYTIPEFFPKDLKISKLPFYKPLEEAYKKNGLIFVASVDRTKTEFYFLKWGRFYKGYELIEYQVPQKIKGGSESWKGLKEKNILNHIEWHLHKHLKDSANDLYFYYKTEKFQKLIIGGHKEIINKFEKLLHPELKNITIKRFYGEPDILVNDVKKEGIKAIERYSL